MYDIESEALNALCDTYLALRDLETAERICDEAQAIAAKYKSARYAARTREARAHIKSARGDIAGASMFWQQALDTSLNRSGTLRSGY